MKKSVDFCRRMWYDIIAWVCVGIFGPSPKFSKKRSA